MKVLIPSSLRSYTGTNEIQAHGPTLDGLLTDMNARFPGVRFRMVDEQNRIRRHMRIFRNSEQIFDLNTALKPADSIQIVQALSGG